MNANDNLTSISIKDIIKFEVMEIQELDMWIQSIINNENDISKELVSYFQKQAISDYYKNFNNTFIIVDENEWINNEIKSNCKIIAMYTLSFSTLDIIDLTKSQRRKMIGGQSYPGILTMDNNEFSVNSLPILLLGKLVKNESANVNNLFDFIFADIFDTFTQINQLASCKFLGLDCVPEVYEKVYEKYGFKIVSKDEKYYNCLINLERNKK